MGIVAAIDLISAIFVCDGTRRRIIVIIAPPRTNNTVLSARTKHNARVIRVEWRTKSSNVGDAWVRGRRGLLRGLGQNRGRPCFFLTSDSEERTNIATYRFRAIALCGVGSQQHMVRKTLWDEEERGVRIYELDKSVLT